MLYIRYNIYPIYSDLYKINYNPADWIQNMGALIDSRQPGYNPIRGGYKYPVDTWIHAADRYHRSWLSERETARAQPNPGRQQPHPKWQYSSRAAVTLQRRGSGITLHCRSAKLAGVQRFRFTGKPPAGGIPAGKRPSSDMAKNRSGAGGCTPAEPRYRDDSEFPYRAGTSRGAPPGFQLPLGLFQSTGSEPDRYRISRKPGITDHPADLRQGLIHRAPRTFEARRYPCRNGPGIASGGDAAGNDPGTGCERSV